MVLGSRNWLYPTRLRFLLEVLRSVRFNTMIDDKMTKVANRLITRYMAIKIPIIVI